MNKISKLSDQCFTRFNAIIDSIPLPEKFTFPFYYEPHPLCKIAANELQHFIENQTEWEWDFHNKQKLPGICMGKMFGVLVVKNVKNEIGYVSAFSGKLVGKNHLKGFVPPVFDMLTTDSFYLKEMKNLNRINDKIKLLENSQELSNRKELWAKEQKQYSEAILNKKQSLKTEKAERKKIREEAKERLSPKEYEDLDMSLINESLKAKRELKDLIKYWENRLNDSQQELELLNNKLIRLKEERKAKSAFIQEELFKQYQFSDKEGNKKGLIDIFKTTTLKRPPAAAGECAAPKLLQYAFLNKLQPIAMAEFWWGQSPDTEIRKHGHFYPACRGKCEPILGHMLKGIKMDENPMLADPEFNDSIEIVYEDDSFAAINKPHEFLSVPGKNTIDSVFERMRLKFPNATGPLIVHRLDMATSGIMLIAKTQESHKKLQAQFIKRRVKKTYIALLDGIIEENEGLIDLPLRVDLDDRPRQMVCYEHGKPAQTRWKVVNRENNKTRILFYPITGRTHQLRVHAAHHLGLNTPIVGDDLYGTKANRLHLHAQSIEFIHPITKKTMSIEIKPEF